MAPSSTTKCGSSIHLNAVADTEIDIEQRHPFPFPPRFSISTGTLISHRPGPGVSGSSLSSGGPAWIGKHNESAAKATIERSGGRARLRLRQLENRLGSIRADDLAYHRAAAVELPALAGDAESRGEYLERCHGPGIAVNGDAVALAQH